MILIYEYKAKVLSVYDGDTITVEIDLGFNVKTKQKLRLLGINTPELRGGTNETKALGILARDYLRDLILDKEIIVNTEKIGKYGRYLANIFYDGININNQMITEGYAVVYD